MFGRQKKIWVTASDAGATAFCPHALTLKYSGHRIGHEAQRLRDRGTQKHHDLNQVVDRRCFVATYAFGPNDSRTWNLRWYRDEVASSSWFGRHFILLYYFVSPMIVKVAIRYPTFGRCIKALLILCIGRGASND